MSLTDDQILGVLANMEQEQNFYDQMRASWKSIRDVINRYKEIQAKMPALVKEVEHLNTVRDNLAGEIESKRRAAATKIQEEADVLHKQMTDRIEPLRQALEEASARVTRAEELAVETEKTAAERIKSALSAADSAEARLAKAQGALGELEKLTRRQ